MRRDLIWARENLTDRGRERLHTAFAYDRFDDLECAWTVEEMLRDLHRSPNRATAQAELADRYRCAGIYDVTETNRLAKTLRAREPENNEPLSPTKCREPVFWTDVPPFRRAPKRHHGEQLGLRPVMWWK